MSLRINIALFKIALGDKSTKKETLSKMFKNIVQQYKEQKHNKEEKELMSELAKEWRIMKKAIDKYR